MSAPCTTQGFVLHHQDYSNTSKIIYCLTKDYGLLHLLAKGAKNRKSAFFADCQPFRLIDIQFLKKSGLSLLTSSNTVSLIQFVETKKQFSGFYINELLYRLIKNNQSDTELFMLYLNTMDELLDEDDLEWVLRRFEYSLLGNLGYDFQEYAESIQFDANKYRLNPSDLNFIKVESDDLIQQGVDVFEGIFLQSLAQFNFESFLNYSSQHKRLCRLVLNQLLDGRPLKSRELFAGLNGTAR